MQIRESDYARANFDALDLRSSFLPLFFSGYAWWMAIRVMKIVTETLRDKVNEGSWVR